MQPDFCDGEELRRILLKSVVFDVVRSNDDGQLLQRSSAIWERSFCEDIREIDGSSTHW